MDVLKEGKYFRYVEKAPIWLSLSVIVIAIGIVFMLINKGSTGSAFNYSIHYTGGEKIILEFLDEVETNGQEVKRIVEKYADGESIVQVDLDNPHVVSIRMRVKTGEDASADAGKASARLIREMKEELANNYGGFSATEGSLNPITLEQDHVGPTVGRELINKAIWALIIGCFFIMIYILVRFGRWQMSFAAIGALIHDVLITLGMTAMLKLEVSDSYIAVILTIIGYSINDTIIIFDRIRENIRNYGDEYPLPQICNLSLNQTLIRSINTVITVIFMILALMVMGGNNIRDFLIAMLIGMISGGYSSIFVATPLMLWFSRGKLTIAEETSIISSAPTVTIEVPDENGESTVEKMVTEKKKKATKKQRRR